MVIDSFSVLVCLCDSRVGRHVSTILFSQGTPVLGGLGPHVVFSKIINS